MREDMLEEPVIETSGGVPRTESSRYFSLPWDNSKQHSFRAFPEIKGHKSLNIKDFSPPSVF